MIQSTLVNKVSVLFISLLIALAGMTTFWAGNATALFDCDPSLSGAELSRCQACSGAGGAAFTDGKCQDSAGKDGAAQVDSMLKTVINILSLIVGVASVIMIMIGGFKYVISQGDANNITSAKNTILYAVIGLVVVAMAQIIVIFVINKATSTPPPTVFIQQLT